MGIAWIAGLGCGGPSSVQEAGIRDYKSEAMTPHTHGRLPRVAVAAKLLPGHFARLAVGLHQPPSWCWAPKTLDYCWTTWSSSRSRKTSRLLADLHYVGWLLFIFWSSSSTSRKELEALGLQDGKPGILGTWRWRWWSELNIIYIQIQCNDAMMVTFSWDWYLCNINTFAGIWTFS